MKIVLEFVNIRSPVDHSSAFGRVAFSCPAAEVDTCLASCSFFSDAFYQLRFGIFVCVCDLVCLL